MTPPELTGDTPVLDILKPVLVGVLIFLRIELDVVVHHWRQRNICKMLHAEEPLERETWLDSGVWVALRVAHLVGVVLNTLHQSCLFEVFCYLLAAVEAVHTYIEWRLLGNRSVGIEDIDGLKIVGLAKHIVVGVVGRSNLQASCTKLNIHISVFDDRNHTTYKGYDDLTALEPLVLRVFRVDTHSGVTHDGFWTCGGHNSIIAFGILMNDVAFCQQGFFIVQ